MRTPTPRILNTLLRRALAAAPAGAVGALTPVLALANPTGGQVTAGKATIAAPTSNGLVITQGSQSAVINWQQFSVGSNEYVQFIQPSSSAVVLNRVVGGNASTILGDIKANGQVFLVNPNGILFGRGASLDVGGLVASTQGISDSDFMLGHYQFQKATGALDATVVNQGAITANSGYVVLAGDYVENDGVINAQSGRVLLAAGGGTTLTFANNQLVSYTVDSATLARLAGVANTGSIVADGGTVVMTADVANALTASAVNNSGLITAHSIQSRDGVIILSARGADIDNSGTLDASATDAGVAGGTVILRGNGHTQLASTSIIDTEGDGARGGFIELSGHTLHVGGQVDKGQGGSLLIDPTTINIKLSGAAPAGTNSVTVGAFYIAGQLASGNVTLVAGNTITYTGGSAVSIAATAPHNLTMEIGTLTAGAGTLGGVNCVAFGVCNPGAGTNVFTKTTGGSITLGNLGINIKGTFTANASQGNVSFGNVKAAAVNVVGGTIHVNGNVTASAGKLSISAKHGPATAATINVLPTKALTGKSVNITASGSYGGIISAGAINATGGSITIGAHGLTGLGTHHFKVVTGNLTATGAVQVLGNGSAGGTLSIGNVAIGNGVMISGSGGKALVKIGNVHATGGPVGVTIAQHGHSGSLRVGSVSAAAVSVSLNAGDSVGGGNVTIGNVAAAKSVKLVTNDGGVIAFGNINANGKFGGSTSIKSDAVFISNTTIAGSVQAAAGSKITATTGSVKILGGTIALGSISAGGSVQVNAVRNTGKAEITEGATQTIKAGLGVNLNASATGAASQALLNVGNVTAGGSVTLHAGQSNTTLNSAAVNAGNVTGKKVTLHVDGGPFSKLILGNVTATGSKSSDGINFTVQNFSRAIAVDTGALTTAKGKITGFASGNGAVSFGNLTAPKIQFNANGKGDKLTTGAITAVSTAGSASVSLFDAAGASNGAITVNGNITVTGKTPAHPNSPGPNGLPAPARLFLSGNASTGHAMAVHVNGAVNVTANAGSFSMSQTVSETSGAATLTTKGKGGTAAVNLAAQGGLGSVSVTGPITAKGTDADVLVTGNVLKLGNITVTGSGHQITRKLAGPGSVNTFSSNNSAGQAVLGFAGAGGSSSPSAPPPVAASIKVGNIVVSGKGLAQVFMDGTNISAGTLQATATAAKGARHTKGTPPKSTCVSSCSNANSGGFFHDFEGNNLGSGSFNGGRAEVVIGQGGSTAALAKSIKVGNITVTGVGVADIGLFGSTVQTGNLTALATKGSESGVGSTHLLNSLHTASVGVFKRSFKGTGGEAGMQLFGGSGGVTVTGNISATGPTAGVKIHGKSVSVSGGITIAGSGGGSLTTDTVFTPKTGTGYHTHFVGPGHNDGLTLQATATVSVGGTVKITGPGITGALIDAGTVTLGGLSASDTGPKHYSILDTRVSSTATSFTASSLGFVISGFTTVAGSPVFTPAVVNGNVSLKANGSIYLPDELAVSGTFSAKAGGNIVGNGTGFILHIRQIDNVLGHNAGSSKGVTSASVPHLHLSAQAAKFSAGGSIGLNSGAITVGTGLAPGVTGDSTLLAVLAAEKLAPVATAPNAYFKAGTTLSLGGVTLTGDYLYLQADTVSVAGPVSLPAKAVVQVSPSSATLPIDIEDTTLLAKGAGAVRTESSSPTLFGLTNAAFLSLFPGDTIVVGNSAELANVTLASLGKITLASGTNLVIDTTGNVTGLSNVTGTGTVIWLESVLGPPVPPVTVGQIDPTADSATNTGLGDQTDKKKLGSSAGQGQSAGQQNGTVSSDTSQGSVCH